VSDFLEGRDAVLPRRRCPTCAHEHRRRTCRNCGERMPDFVKKPPTAVAPVHVADVRRPGEAPRSWVAYRARVVAALARLAARGMHP
jgi:hypothetical protein